jgi:DNA-binding beta-propeller fold protein YncE
MRGALISVAAGALFLCSAAHAADKPPLRAAGYIEVPGPKGKRFDYLTIVPEKQYLFATHLGAGLLYVVDLKTNKVIKTISDVPGIEGVEAAIDANKIYTSDWYENKIGVVDFGSLRLIRKIPTEAKPDGIAYAAPFHKLYVSDERGKAEAVVDVTRDEVVTTLHFDSETGNVRFDPVSRRVLLSLQDKNVLVEIDPATDKEVARHPVGECRGNHGMALDTEHRLAFLVCEDNNLLAIFDLNSHRVTAALPLPDGGDVVAYDPGLRRIYVACYSGFISVFREDDAQHVRKLADVSVEKKVHSLAIDLNTHKLYVPEQEAQGRTAARIAIYDALPDPSEQSAH